MLRNIINFITIIYTLLVYTHAQEVVTIPLSFYSDNVNIPFGIETKVSGVWPDNSETFYKDINVTVNMNMPFSIFFNWDLIPAYQNKS